MFVHKVIFALEAKEFVGAIMRHAAWPSLKIQSEMLSLSLQHITLWKVVKEDRKANRGAFLIALSVIREDQWHPYAGSDPKDKSGKPSL